MKECNLDLNGRVTLIAQINDILYYGNVLLFVIIFTIICVYLDINAEMEMNSLLETEVLQLHAEICAGLADPNRIMILYELSAGTRNVTELCASLKMPQPLTSRHLKILRERGMVTAERQGTVIQYSLADNRLIEALDLLRSSLRDTLSRRAQLVNAI